MPSPICTTVLLLMLFFFSFFFGEGDRQGDVLAWRRVRDGNGVSPLDKTFSFFPLPPPLSTSTSGISNKKKSKNWWLAWSYLLVGESFFFFKPVETLSGIELKAWSFVGQVIVEFSVYQRWLPTMSAFKLAGCTISITWALSWNTLRPSTQHHYNSPMVNNHKSNEIHKPLRWCLLSLTLGSSDIHSLEVCAFKPIICSIYAIFPSFYHMNYALCHNLPEYFSSQESYAVLISSSLLVHHITMRHLSPYSRAYISIIDRQSHKVRRQLQNTEFGGNQPFWSRKVRCLSLGQVHEKLMQFTLTPVKVYSFQKEATKT